ncbi:hypothetical protein ABZ897_55310 [Nonomuraea sp. NPDC046802]|uniref:hypothetical protein n=1 Tax=Nonomuraea sp. NPDC046802 TaxID=3154919 RepID=UPI0033D8B6E2
MAQLYKGKRDTSTFAVPLELKGRIEAAGERCGYKKPGVYLTDLISALHPDHRQQPKFAASIRSVIPRLLARAPELAPGDAHVFAIRTRVGVKSRIKSGYMAFGCSHMTAYLVALMSALHPATPKPQDDHDDVRDVPTLTPEVAQSLVSILLDGALTPEVAHSLVSILLDGALTPEVAQSLVSILLDGALTPEVAHSLVSILLDGALTPEVAQSLVSILLDGGVDTPLPNADSTSGYEQQAFLDLSDLKRSHQTAA